MRETVLAAAMATLLMGAGPALAMQTGAPAAAPTQPGAWGPQGWQAGTAPAAPAMASSPEAMMQPGFSQPPAPAMASAPAPAVSPHVYDQIERGRKVKGPAVAPVNTVADPRDWGLPQPPAGMRWIRYYDDAVLLDAADHAVDVRSVAWDMPRNAPAYAYAGQPYYAPMPMQPMRAPGTYVSRRGSVVTTTQVLPPPAMIGGGYGPYGQIVAVTPGTITTTTRTVWVSGGRSIRHRAAHRRCGCGS